MRIFIIVFMFLTASILNAQILIPMDHTQTDHLKAYGIAFEALKQDIPVRWLLVAYNPIFIIDIVRSNKGIEYSGAFHPVIFRVIPIIADFFKDGSFRKPAVKRVDMTLTFVDIFRHSF